MALAILCRGYLAGPGGARAGLGRRWGCSSRLTLESNYNDRRRNPSLGRESSWRGVPGAGGAPRYAHAAPRPAPPRPAAPARTSARPVRTPTPRTVITQFVRTPHFQGRPSVFMAAATAALIPDLVYFSFFLFRNWLNLFSYVCTRPGLACFCSGRW